MEDNENNCEEKRHFISDLDGKTSPTEEHVMKHLHNHSAEKSLVCEKCSESFSEKHLIETHVCSPKNSNRDFPKCLDEDFSSCILEKDLSAAKCTEVLDGKDNSEDKFFICDICDGSYSSKSNLKRHKKMHDSENFCIPKNSFGEICNEILEAIVKSANKFFICDICEGSFSCKSNLNRHKKLHDNENFKSSRKSFGAKRRRKGGSTKKIFICDICQRSFTTRFNLNRHQKSHNNEKFLRPSEKNFFCDICNNRFLTKCGLNRHVVKHSGEKPFSCGICGKKFALSYQLHSHVVVHTAEKHFSCEICKKEFAWKKSLSQHIRTHTQEKPYFCELCNRKFSDVSNLKRHRRTHTKERPFACEVCYRAFSSKNEVIRHHKVHAKQKHIQQRKSVSVPSMQ